MRFKFALSAAITAILGVALSFGSVTSKKTAGEGVGEKSEVRRQKSDCFLTSDPRPLTSKLPQPLPAVGEQASVPPAVKQMKDILSRLVRQDEYLDEAIETLDTANTRLDADDISALGLSLKLIKGNMDNASALNKAQFIEVQPGLNLSSYTRAILSYSAKMNAKVSRIGLLARRLSAKNKKTAMRDAVSAKTGKKVRGKSIARLLDEQQALKQLSVDIKNLKASSAGLTAVSKWLYIVSK